MITELSAQNFKSWEDTGKLQFAPLTGFFGANNSGKTVSYSYPTSAQADCECQGIEFPTLLSVPNNSLVNLGDFDTVIHRHDRSS